MFYNCLSSSNSTASLKSILNQYHKRINILEDQKYDLEFEVAKKDFEVYRMNFVNALDSFFSLSSHLIDKKKLYKK